MSINYNKGFAILYAVLLVSIVLTVSLSLINITFKQLVLSSFVRESQVVFYTADQAFNCLSYWIAKGDSSLPSPVYIFGTFNSGAGQWSASNQKTIYCADPGDINNNKTLTIPAVRTSQEDYDPITMDYTVGGIKYCAVLGIKRLVVTGGEGTFLGKIELTSNGYNDTCNNVLNHTTGMRTVERGLKNTFDFAG